MDWFQFYLSSVLQSRQNLRLSYQQHDMLGSRLQPGQYFVYFRNSLYLIITYLPIDFQNRVIGLDILSAWQVI